MRGVAFGPSSDAGRPNVYSLPFFDFCTKSETTLLALLIVFTLSILFILCASAYVSHTAGLPLDPAERLPYASALD